MGHFPPSALAMHSPARSAPIRASADSSSGEDGICSLSWWPPTNTYWLRCPWVLANLTQQKQTSPRRDPSWQGYGAAAAHSSPQGKVTQTCLPVSCQAFIHPQEGPHIPFEAVNLASQDHTELALKSSSCETLCWDGLKREHPPSHFLSAATLKMACII